MSNNSPDYENDLVFPPKSADDLNKQGRESDVLVTAIEKCAKLEQELKHLKELLKECRDFLDNLYYPVIHEDYDTNITNNLMNDILTRINAAIGER